MGAKTSPPKVIVRVNSIKARGGKVIPPQCSPRAQEGAVEGGGTEGLSLLFFEILPPIAPNLSDRKKCSRKQRFHRTGNGT